MDFRQILVAQRGWISIVLLLAFSGACREAPTGTPPQPPIFVQPSVMPTHTNVALAAVPTDARAPTPSPTPALTTTASADAAPTLPAVPTTLPTTRRLPSATPTLAILTFTVDVADSPTGKRLTFHWKTTGASQAIIWSGTQQRFPPSWEVPPSGTLTVELTFTLYRDPSMSLTAYDSHGQMVSQSVQIQWACRYDYFFTLASARCPAAEAFYPTAAEQPFEHGRMIWLERIEGYFGTRRTLEKIILVLYDDGQLEKYDDTWAPGELESDPALVPPAGLYQPVRGFGKLWRENESVRERLGWALAPEQGFESAWQKHPVEGLGEERLYYLRTLDNGVILASMPDGAPGSWSPLP